MDPLSVLLSVMKPRTCMAGGFDHGGEWSVQFGQHDGIKCYALISGQCMLQVEGTEEPVLLQPGDCFLLPHGRPFRLATDLSLPPLDFRTIFKVPLNGRVVTWNGGGKCFGVGGHFTLGNTQARRLLAELPPVVYMRAESDKTELRGALHRMAQELREQRPGASLVVEQLATMVMVLVLRLHLAKGPTAGSGWLSALADPQMCTAITAMHDNPAHRWTLEKLAALCGMSRTIFAQRFKSTVGTSPMEYLTRWRMILAEDRLTGTDDSVAAIAASLGYESESAFSKAFRRVTSLSPRQVRRSRSTLQTTPGTEATYEAAPAAD